MVFLLLDPERRLATLSSLPSFDARRQVFFLPLKSPTTLSESIFQSLSIGLDTSPFRACCPSFSITALFFLEFAPCYSAFTFLFGPLPEVPFSLLITLNSECFARKFFLPPPLPRRSSVSLFELCAAPCCFLPLSRFLSFPSLGSKLKCFLNFPVPPSSPDNHPV